MITYKTFEGSIGPILWGTADADETMDWQDYKGKSLRQELFETIDNSKVERLYLRFKGKFKGGQSQGVGIIEFVTCTDKTDAPDWGDKSHEYDLEYARLSSIAKDEIYKVQLYSET